MKIQVLTTAITLVILSACQSKTEKTESATSEFKGVNANVKLNSFPYVSPRPVNGQLKGVIELGGSGFNSFIIEVDSEKRWKLVDEQYGESNVYENEATEEDIKSGLENYISGMIEKGVEGSNIHFVQSSTASNNERVQQINPILDSMGYQVNNVSVDMESTYAFYASSPQEFRSESFVVDMGSGNTKISWMKGDSVYSLGTFGTKYFQNETTDEEVFNEIKKLVSGIPSTNRKKCFVIGGVPYTLAKQEDEFHERYTVLKAPDQYEGVEDPKQRSGLNIYRAMTVAAPECEGFIFDWSSNFSIGFLLAL